MVGLPLALSCTFIFSTHHFDFVITSPSPLSSLLSVCIFPSNLFLPHLPLLLLPFSFPCPTSLASPPSTLKNEVNVILVKDAERWICEASTPVGSFHVSTFFSCKVIALFFFWCSFSPGNQESCPLQGIGWSKIPSWDTTKDKNLLLSGWKWPGICKQYFVFLNTRLWLAVFPRFRL